MAVTLNAFLRITIIDKLIAAGGLNRRQLFRKLNEALSAQDKPTVSIETLDGDIKAMKVHFHAPIVNSQRWGYCYSVQNFSLFSDELSSSELHDLGFVMDLLNTRYTDIPQVRTAVEILARIYRRQAGAEREERIVYASANNETRGAEWLKRLHMAHDRQECLSVKTLPAGTARFGRYRLSPWAFIENGSGLDVVGYCADAEEVVQIPVAAIVDVEPAIGLAFRPAGQFNMDEYIRVQAGTSGAKVPQQA